MSMPIITLLTDFGEKDPYVGAMKGVILSICPSAKIIDLSHQIQEHNAREGAIFLNFTGNYYPKGTVHLVVIDPGVGSQRKALIIQTNNYYFVGPDNGVLSLAAERDKVQKVFEANNSTYFLTLISNTFHGRDIFAPIAAHLANHEPIENFGPLIQDWIKIKIPKVHIDDEIHAEIIHIDRFGNLITNIPQKLLKEILELENKSIEVRIKHNKLIIPLCTSYDQVPIGEILGIIGSNNFLEISKNQGSAADTLGTQVQEKISIKLISN